MRKTYITRMPDKAGAFLAAGRIISGYGGNIVRVNYNKAVDIHTLFIEVNATAPQHKKIEDGLSEIGYLKNEDDGKRIIMIVLTLDDVPGAVLPILEVLGRHNVNISYMSSQENGTDHQHFKMGLLVDDTNEITDLIEEISKICEIKIPDYEVTDRLLDGTVFYVTFANEMREILGLSQKMTNDLLIISNRLMQTLDDQNRPVLQTFDYIRKFAKLVRMKKGKSFKPVINKIELDEGYSLYSIEPPCGSNTFILEHEGELLFVDCGFSCYRNEMLEIFKDLFPGFESKRKRIIITHADVDHTGLLDLFDTVYLSGSCYDNFRLQLRGEKDFREQNPNHQSYCFLSKIISDYTPVMPDRCCVIGRKNDSEMISYIGKVDFDGLELECFEGVGGHVKGETVIVCEKLNLVFSGDIYVNIKGYSPEQKEFNTLAPFLMTGVDSDSKMCRLEREELLSKYTGYYFCPGHGSVFKN